MAGNLLIMFDLDGTLVNTVDSIIICANKVRVLHHFPERDPSEIYSKVGLPPKEFFNDLDLSPEQSIKLVADFRIELNDMNFDDSDLYPGTCELLEFFKGQGVPLAIATNKPTANAELLLAKTAISGYFVTVQGSDGLNPKPHPDILLKVSSDLGINKAIMVGDRSEDIIAANEAGFQSIGLAQTFHSKSELESSGAFLVFEGMQDLAKAVDLDFFRDRILS